MRWAPRFVLVLAIVCAAVVAVSSAGGQPSAVRHAAKKRCHVVTKKVRGKKKRVRVCTTEPKPKPATPAPSADLIVSGFAPEHAAVGDQVTFQVNILNRGPSVATGVSLAIDTPIALTGLRPALSDDQAAACDTPADGPTAFRCRLDQLPVGGVWMLQFVGTASTAGSLRFAAAARATTLDPTPKNAAVDVETQVDPPPPPPPPPPS